MKVITTTGTIDLGTTESQPTIGITDYSRRVTDDFGTTTVVERGFSRRMSVRLALPSDQVDRVQQQLADLRATPVQWVADDRFAWLNVTGFYKDFTLDLATPSLSYCTLTVEGLAETTTAADPGGDPAPDGSASTLRLLQPVEVTNAVLTASNVPENDHPEWNAVSVYAAGARVMKAALHRIYESLGNGNSGRDPAEQTGHWIEVGPTNRWAMFDQALGTLTTANSSISVTLNAAGANAIGLLDVTAEQVRVTASGYDRTAVPGRGAVTFTDLPAGPVTVQVIGSAALAVGTLLIGRMVALGTTEASPTAGINDFSRKEFDDFGAPVVVPRAWSKTMQAKALIRTDALDAVANRIAAVRARPSLWIGDAEFDSLTVYGFFKDFGIEVGENVSTLSLSVEGLSEAAPMGSLPGLVGPINWTDVIDNDPIGRPRPQDGADVTGENIAKDVANVGGRPSDQITQAIDDAHAAINTALGLIEDGAESAEAQFTDVRSRVAAARARADAAHTRIDEISSETGTGTVDTYARSRLAEIQTAFTAEDVALAERIDLAEASFGAAIDARVQEVTTAFGDADAAYAAQSLELSARAGAGNLLTNTDVAVDTSGWVFGSQNGSIALRNGAGSDRKLPNENNLTIFQPNANGSDYSEFAQAVTAHEDRWYDLSVYASARATQVEIIALWLDANGASIDADSPGRFTAGLGGSRIDLWTLRSFKILAPPGTRQVRMLLRKYGTISATDSYAWFMRPQIKETTALALSPLAYSPGSAQASLTRADARITETSEVAASASASAAQTRQELTATTNDLTGRITNAQTVASDAKSASAQTRSDLTATANDLSGRITETRGVAVNALTRTASSIYQNTVGGNNGRAQMTMYYIDQNGNVRTGIDFVGNSFTFSGDAIFSGTVTARAFNGPSMNRYATAVWSGSISPSRGNTDTIPWGLSFPSIPPTGRFIYELFVTFTTNANTQTVGTNNGKPFYTNHLPDGGGVTVQATDNQGNVYVARANGSDVVRATTDFVPNFRATIRRGSLDTGIVDMGDYYQRDISATYTVTRVDGRFTWVAI